MELLRRMSLLDTNQFLYHRKPIARLPVSKHESEKDFLYDKNLALALLLRDGVAGSSGSKERRLRQ